LCPFGFTSFRVSAGHRVVGRGCNLLECQRRRPVRTLACSSAECSVSSNGQQFLGRNWLRRACSWDLDCALREDLVGILGMEGRQVQGSCGPRAGPYCYRRCRLGRGMWARACWRLPASARCWSPCTGRECVALCGRAGDVAAVSSLLCLFPHPPLPCLIIVCYLSLVFVCLLCTDVALLSICILLH